MKKKKIIILLVVLIIMIVVYTCFVLVNKDKTQIDNKKIKTTQISFTIGDRGTEIETEIKNNNNAEVNIEKITANIYNENNKKVGTITKNTNITLKSNKKQKVLLTSKDKYVNASKIKYKIN